MEVPTKIQVGFHLAEVGQDLHEGPLVIAPGGPVVVVLRDTAVEPLPINGAGAPGRLATRDLQRRLLRRDGGDIVPAMGPIGRQPHIVAQHEVIGEMLEVRVIRSGLEEAHRPARILRQAGCQDTASRPCTNDNHVVSHTILSSMNASRRCKSRQYTPGPMPPQALDCDSVGQVRQCLCVMAIRHGPQARLGSIHRYSLVPHGWPS